MFRRHRRLRKNSYIRDMVRETTLSPNDFIYPLFVVEGINIKKEIPSLPNNYHYSLDRLPEVISEINDAGVKGIILFGIPDYKDEIGSSAFDENGIIQKAIRKIREIDKDLFIITDVCMCEYTSHGHCGIIHDGYVDNDETLKYIGKIALSHAKAGADMIAPSDMMDGRIEEIRTTLDENGYKNVSIMAYSAKYCSAFYGPFRDAADSAPKFGDRKSYQMDPANAREAMLEIEDDIEEGADVIMVKPALAYLDILRTAKNRFDVPVAAYSVSGEYSMIKAGAKMGWIDEKAIALESLLSIKRAGADMIITYYALEASKWLK
ncbi:porphobilinogen synthase [Clostridium acetobutylicum]|uniref:Delta-aminolevulinic acid dehydratase n=1 Tax=Clostridium acetobutylicum (strain ATCC 824 / DSM 792 / JCM 1419 / IAM 19013 / LMG 5710 / NBRC 13948 / NRRL B-527 / VKM B-1787 / 2291 / W) TaxID=272562 RepID=Q97MU1_CLOAB|nr:MULTISPECIES: porphobilinogen synthase [Clostridium]AAK78085.1 Delta-aminolevulinic acid dehydratase (porphobilinogen synthase) [Clostridium acetobutylicum ATCC 824]ADZ19144.1 delta-aminolevulinic acid dehydratase [Clostridium acetobutylicum EA 2018]AEI34103.1 delta-aminolevulinic acid dehydratase [Clostridium acetobutylicum DSM 1731]AWV81852.1 porphobilinogen synthase [Clostridium acetobutylicum]MBC2395400.1 porphobilinogen synthase [Clostridium acetobutylicum]